MRGLKRAAALFSILLPAVAAAQQSARVVDGKFPSANPLFRFPTTENELVPRLPRQAVKPLVVTESDPVDTLDTMSEFVKVVLYGNGTWKYIKTEDFAWDNSIFTADWDNRSVDPYKLSWDSLPSYSAIWLVDSLSNYSCPYQGKVNPRGKFGPRRGRRHQGVDLPLTTGTPIHAAFNGKVRISSSMHGYGNVVVIRHENGLETFYGHLSKRNVEAGDWVNAGDVIGLGGSTGRSTGPHLHFETRYNGYAFDPQWLIDFETGVLRHRMFVLKKKYLSQFSNYEQNFDDELKSAEEDAAEEAALKAMRWHIVKSGDTLGRIAINNGTTVSAICRLNGIKSTSTLRIGQKLRVR